MTELYIALMVYVLNSDAQAEVIGVYRTEESAYQALADKLISTKGLLGRKYRADHYECISRHQMDFICSEHDSYVDCVVQATELK